MNHSLKRAIRAVAKEHDKMFKEYVDLAENIDFLIDAKLWSTQRGEEALKKKLEDLEDLQEIICMLEDLYEVDPSSDDGEQ